MKLQVATLAICTAVTAAAAQGQTTTFPLIAPTSAATQEGPASTALPFGSSLARHVQYAYDGAVIDFAAPMRIGAITLRPDGNTPGGSAAGSYNFTLSCSTSVNPSGALSATFEANHGSDRVVVHRGPLAISAPSLGQAPNEFSLRVPFTTPFEWDPRNGPLLLDIQYSSATPAFGAWDAVANQNTTGGISANGSATLVATSVLSTAPVIRLECLGDTVPSEAEAATSTGFPWNRSSGTGMRTQNLYEGSAMPTGRRRITALAWRTDLGVAFGGRTYDVRISMSTSAATATTLSQTFAANHGSDLTVVFDGLLIAAPSPASTDLTHFDLFCELQRPFEYDPGAGALVVDMQVRNATGPTGASFDATLNSALPVARVSNPSDANAGDSGTNLPQPGVALVMALRSVPTPIIPASLALAVNSVSSQTSFPWGSAACRTLGMLSAVEAGITQPTFVRHLRFRPTATPTFGPSTFTCTIDISNPTNTPTTVSAAYDQNHGGNRIRVFDGRFSVPFGTRSATDTGFPIEVKLDRAFLWDPVTRPYLSVDIVVSDRVGPAIPVETTNNRTVDDARVFASGASASTGTAQQLAFVMQIGGETANGLAVNYGAGCGGTNGVPSSTTIGVPSLPNREFGVRVRQAAGNSLAFFLIGLTAANTPLAGAPGCVLLNGLEFGTIGSAITSPTGEALVPLPLPRQPDLDGVTLLTQWVVLDPSANALGLVSSDGVELTLRFF